MQIEPHAEYFFKKSGNRVRALRISEPEGGMECWVVGRVDGASAGKQMIVRARSLVLQME